MDENTKKMIENDIKSGKKVPKDYKKRSEYLFALKIRQNMEKSDKSDTQIDNSDKSDKNEKSDKSDKISDKSDKESDNESDKKSDKISESDKLSEPDKVEVADKLFTKSEEKLTPEDQELQQKLQNALDSKIKNLDSNPANINIQGKSKEQIEKEKTEKKKEEKVEDINNDEAGKFIVKTIVDFEKSHYFPVMQEDRQQRMASNLSIVFDRYLPEQFSHYFPEMMLGIDSLSEILNIATYVKRNPVPPEKLKQQQEQKQKEEQAKKTEQPKSQPQQPPRQQNGVNGWSEAELKEAIRKSGGNPDTFHA